MYDAGGINIKPGDAMHLLMKHDMAGAGAILGTMSALAALGCPTTVTGYLMCTDNMPSGSAMKMGDVLRIHGGTTVEVQNTDAEGRLVMADALVLATERDDPDAIVDIATLTGAAVLALGPKLAAVMGNDQALVDQVVAAAERTDERVWQLPLERRYRGQLNSEIADLKNMGDGPSAGAITAGAVPGGVRGRVAVGAPRHRRHDERGCRRRLALVGRNRLRRPPAARPGALLPTHASPILSGSADEG